MAGSSTVTVASSKANKVHKCTMCDKAFARPNKLHQHIDFSHRNKYPYECSICGKPYSSKDHANRHYQKVHVSSKRTEKENLSTFHCSIDNCLKIFANKQNLDRHVRKSHTFNENKIKCPYCEAKVIGIKVFHSHLIDSHSCTPGNYKCIDCPKMFSTIKQLSHHRKAHNVDERIVQRTLENLLSRVEKHVDKLKAYKCDLCDQTFQCLTYLNQHKNSKIHNDYYVCKEESCGKRFAYLRNLRQHYKAQHENVRLICPVVSCSTTFTYQSSLDRHLLNMHTFRDSNKRLKCYPMKGHRRHDIKNLLSGFDGRHLRSKKMLNGSETIHNEMKQLLEILTDTPSIEQTETNNQMEHEENSSSIMTEGSSSTQSLDSLLLNVYNDIGLFLLN
ncbi:unnamed protein product [Didymodactylos carnosus]|uniref:C2H2-type domain-containing protein n=1 Tax=Didymodactylos carnosus TaxID=1234261 RepID=A0A813V1W2_9BILA|nr:unnamed protein product [Didymodactylos carnosus]CAF0872526.1 unnamed protein product [Didymodactylos carnosus]CAF3624369.1 unnamed protein product [Didymodactylos carnosus]CAF3657313.1 unnamed protein product [Didymodactylos carnosus]